MPVKFFFFGDSICNGQGAAIHKGWVARLSALLYDWQGIHIEVHNSSVNGRTTRQALENMPYEIQAQHPDVMLVQLGMNDCNHWATDGGLPRVSPNAFRANMEEIVARAFRFGVRGIFINTNHPTARHHTPMPDTTMTYQEANEAYNRILRDTFAAATDQVILLDIERAFMQRLANGIQLTDLLLPHPDCLHLSEAGHDLYFEIVSHAMTTHLPGLLP